MSAPDPTRFLVRGRLERLPRRAADRDLLFAYVATRVLVLDDPITERELTDRLATFVDDPVGVRRDLVDRGLVTRTRDGATYWRTVVTVFDELGGGTGTGEVSPPSS
ncbi:DUF2087 domain-containing protein [Luteimicrobium sp. NPDC057192]|uniref:DUF2087 domain-containing protein n=1 Tax=Luteimicrobium sp. NPDC057192 TaxID=3346042 RepID=UPI00362EF675